MSANRTNPQSIEKELIATIYPLISQFNKMSALKKGEKYLAMIDDLERMIKEYDCFKNPKEKNVR